MPWEQNFYLVRQAGSVLDDSGAPKMTGLGVVYIDFQLNNQGPVFAVDVPPHDRHMVF